MTQQLDKLNRTDLIKLIGEQVLADLAGEVQRAREAVRTAAVAFESMVVDAAMSEHAPVLAVMAEAAGVRVDQLSGRCLTRVYRDEPLPTAVQVVIADDAMYDAKVKLTVTLHLDETMMSAAAAWQQAMQWEREAETRDTKVSTIREGVRKDLVAELLKGPGGEEVLSAAKRLAVAVKTRLLEA